MKKIKHQFPRKIIKQLAQFSQVNEVHSLYKISKSRLQKNKGTKLATRKSLEKVLIPYYWMSLSA